MSKSQTRGLKLRQTHYILGKDEQNYLSEYNQEYIPKKNLVEENINRGLYLRNSHFVLGNTPLNYKTSFGEQSASIPKKIQFKFDDNLENKIKLQKTNFILGNQKNDYITKYSSEYFNKLPFMKEKNQKKELELISNKLKETHVAPISTQIEYESETQDKFKRPIMTENNRMTINTAALQESHLSLGNNDVPLISSNRYFFTPKKKIELNNDRYNNDPLKLRESNISFSQDKDKNNFRTENMDSYTQIPRNYELNKMDSELKNNLRREHFSFGSEDNPNNRLSSNSINFRDPKTYKNYNPNNYKNTIDVNKYRRSNWTISNGDERDFFKSSYGLTMTPKKPEIKTKKEVKTFRSNIIIGDENQKDGYVSEYRKNYPDGKLLLNLKNLNQDKKLFDTINNIRRSHFNFGESKNDYFTTSGNAYKYDPVLAKEGRGRLNDVLKNNLRSSHYDLSMGHETEKYSSSRRDYISYPNFKPNKKIEKNKESSVFHRNRNVFEGESIYMSNYTEKPSQNPDDNLPDFL